MKLMNILLVALLLIILSACNNAVNETRQMQAEIDSLRITLSNTYRPGFGEFMSDIQTHHAKLWFAGINNNWSLADFEINEIKEALDDIQTYCADRPETKEIKMIYPVIDSISLVIQMQNVSNFKHSFHQMTNMCNENMCNECHSITSHAFNVITVPDKLPVSNQDFKVH